MNVIETRLPGVLLIEPKVFGDSRGFFFESFQQLRYKEVGIDLPFVQDNISYSKYGVLRGLHFQNPNAQGKLVYVLQGEVFDVAVDIRNGSPFFGQWFGTTLSSTNKRQLWVPPGFAHGFLVTSEDALFCYKVTDFYNPTTDTSIRWDDKDIGIEWPSISDISLSKKDLAGVMLKDLPLKCLPGFNEV